MDNDHYRLKPGTTTHVWSIFDRDSEKPDVEQIDPDDDREFSFSIQFAEQNGLHVAWSNDVFELWILLHFEDVQPGVWRHRTYVYERLTEIVKALPDQPTDLAKITGHGNFEYKSFIKKRGNFFRYVIPYLDDRREQATQRAHFLETAFNEKHRYHQCNPCTKVHHLVSNILSFT